ncbi:UvrD-helicase domain-containing protein, partial [candidate division NPL-UPA2 bacterium]|nr:UvrD-helicase domain-containing protein [candidate division NPL-UPA2 bacterium]
MDFPHILVIAASAGAGKTYSLSERYINFLLSPAIKASPRHILAITFTNKAAGEMKERIISRLKEIALSDSELKESARMKLDELLDRYSDLRVQTIDSFLTSVTRSSALELGLPPHFEIVLDSSPALSFVLDELLSRVYQSSRGKQGGIARLFLDLLYELLRMDEETGWDIKRVILKNISDLRKQRFLKGQKFKKLFSYQDIEKKRDSLREALEDFLKGGEGVLDFKKHFVKAANKFIKDRQYQPWESEMFLKREAGELCRKNSPVSPEHQKAWERIREDISSLAEITAHGRFAPFLNFVDLFEDGLQSFKDRSQTIFIEDLNVHLKRFLDKEGIVPEVYFHLGEWISHFFIDEFQDTSRLQWENLFPLIEETLSKRGSLFYVGDRKQAVYRFRGGESALFEEVKRSFPSVEGKSIEERFPEINYRSRENIISFINKTFSPENLALWAKDTDIDAEVPDFSSLLATYAHSAQKIDPQGEKKGGLVRVERIPSREPLRKEELDMAIGKRLVGLIHDNIIPRFPPSDIAILVRTNSEASWVTGVLTRAGLPVASEKTLDISSNSLVRELVSFLAFLDSPVDNFSFACFISGDIFLKVSALTRKEIFSFLLENRKGERPLYTLFRERFPEVWQEHLEEYFRAAGFLPPYDLISR